MPPKSVETNGGIAFSAKKSCAFFAVAMTFSKSEKDAVVHVSHVGPFELTVGEEIEEPPGGSAGMGDVADVVNTDIPLVPGPAERVRETARRIVSLENEDTLTG